MAIIKLTKHNMRGANKRIYINADHIISVEEDEYGGAMIMCDGSYEFRVVESAASVVAIINSDI